MNKTVLAVVGGVAGVVLVGGAILLWSLRGPDTPARRPEGPPPKSAPVDKGGHRPPTGELVLRGTMVPEWRVEARSEWARVYFDVSGSMRGYVGERGFARRDDTAGQLHARLLRRLKDILVQAGALNLEAARFGTKVARPERVSGFGQFGDSALYGEPDTDLAAAVKHALDWERKGIALVVTDGVASVSKDRESSASGPSSAGRCTAGSDSACVALRMRELVATGRGLWIVGLRMPFSGEYWSEEGGPSAKPGTNLGHVTVPDRPLYVWVASADVAQGRAIVQALVEFGASAQPRVETLAVEIGPGAWERWKLPRDMSSEAVQGSVKGCERGGALPGRLHPHDPKLSAPVQDVATRSEGSLALSYPAEERSGAALTGVLPLMRLRQEPLLRQARGNPPEKRPALDIRFRRGTEGQTSAQGRLELCVTGHPPKSLSATGWDVMARWRAELTTEAPWEAWSSDTDDRPDTLRRTVSLSIFFKHLRAELTRKREGEVLEERLLRIEYDAGKK